MESRKGFTKITTKRNKVKSSKVLFISLIMAATACGSDSPGSIGDPCEVDADCEQKLCLTTLVGDSADTTVTFPGGTCSEPCLEGNTACPDSLDACILHPNSGRTFCLPKCRASTDCRSDEGYTCEDLGSFAQSLLVCLPPLG